MKQVNKQRVVYKTLVAALVAPVFSLGISLHADEQTGTNKNNSPGSTSQYQPPPSGLSTPTPTPPTSTQPALEGQRGQMREAASGSKTGTLGSQVHTALQYRALIFAPHSAELSMEQKSQISNLLAGLRDKATVNIGAWADKAWHPEADKDFTKEDRELASERLRVIENYIKDSHPGIKVKTFNMTERAGVLAKIFNTKEAEFKAVFAKNAQMSAKHKVPQEALVLRDQGGANKAVLVLSKSEGEVQNPQS